MACSRLPAVLTAGLLLSAYGCSPREALTPRVRPVEPVTTHRSENWKESCPASFETLRDYFPEKTSFQYSSQLRVEYHGSYKLVLFTTSLHARDPLRFVLYQCGTPRPANIAADQFISVPVQRVVLNEPSFGESLVELGTLGHVYAVNDAEAFSTPALNEAIERGDVRALGSRSSSTIELAAATDPDLVFLFYSAAPNANLHPALLALGVHGIPLAPQFERDALGRAEWLKFTALFFNREAEADRLLAPRVLRYRQLASWMQGVPGRPAVVLGFPSNKDTWTSPGSRNVYAQTVRDAGGRYFLRNEEVNSNVRTSYEAVLAAAEGADVWIGWNGVNRVADLRALQKGNPQLAELEPVRHGTVYAMDRGISAKRTFPFTDQSVDHPDTLLADFIRAIHPELPQDGPSTFLRKLR